MCFFVRTETGQKEVLEAVHGKAGGAMLNNSNSINSGGGAAVGEVLNNSSSSNSGGGAAGAVLNNSNSSNSGGRAAGAVLNNSNSSNSGGGAAVGGVPSMRGFPRPPTSERTPTAGGENSRSSLSAPFTAAKRKIGKSLGKAGGGVVSQSNKKPKV